MTNYDKGNKLQLDGAKVPKVPQAEVKKVAFQYDLGVYLNAIMHEGQVWFPCREIYELLGRSGKNGSTYIKKFPERTKRYIRVTRPSRPDGVKVWHISREGVALAIERSKECTPAEAKKAHSLEIWLTREVYPELPEDEPQETIVVGEEEPSEEELTPEHDTDVATVDEIVNQEATFALMVELNENQELGVSGRMLHQFLEVNTRYNDWFDRMCSFGFEEGHDYACIGAEVSYSNLSRIPNTVGAPEINHRLTVDMAKEIAMLQRNERGKQARQYFIQIEKEWNSPDKVMARALKIAERQIGEYRVLTAKQQETIALLEPKANQYDKVMSAESTYTVTDVAFLNDWQASKLFKLLVEIGWMDRGRNNKHYVTRNAPEGLFKIIKTIYGEQIRVTQAGYQAMKELIKDNDK